MVASLKVSWKRMMVWKLLKVCILPSTFDLLVNPRLDAFILKLHHKLQISSETTISPDAVLLELGIDSLVAAELRAWFVTEVGVDMPILKILGGPSILELVTDVVGRLPQALLPVSIAESEPKSELVQNVLGGLDLVVKRPDSQPVASQSPKEKGNSVLIPPPAPAAPLKDHRWPISAGVSY